MSTVSDRSLWLAHLNHCTLCPVNRCPRGDELAAAVRETLHPGEHWQGIYRPHRTEHGPAHRPRN